VIRLQLGSVHQSSPRWRSPRSANANRARRRNRSSPLDISYWVRAGLHRWAGAQ
jgi:hypothetical protein